MGGKFLEEGSGFLGTADIYFTSRLFLDCCFTWTYVQAEGC